MTCKPMKSEHFTPGEYYWARCPECKGRLNVFEKTEKLEEPEVFGSSTPNPVTMTHQCLIRCKCKKTRVLWSGTVEQIMGIGCSAD